MPEPVCRLAGVSLLLLLQMTPPAATQPAPLPEWLLGNWAETTPTGRTEEHWTRDGDAFNGAGKTFKADKLVFTETLRIERGPDGTLQYVATPKGQATTTFKAVEASDGFLAFENPAHDYPTRITYRLTAPDTIVAEISGVRNGKPASKAWTYLRVK